MALLWNPYVNPCTVFSLAYYNVTNSLVKINQSYMLLNGKTEQNLDFGFTEEPELQ